MCLTTAQTMCLAAMERKALELRVQKGVSVVVILNNWDPNATTIHTKTHEEFVGDEEGGRWNYLAIALAKVAQMLDTCQDSGPVTDRIPREGENTYRGGLTAIVRNHRVLVAFSGGTEEQDVAIAASGLEAYQTAPDR